MIKYVLCVGLGVGVGYFAAMKKLEADNSRLLVSEMDNLHTMYEDRFSKREKEFQDSYAAKLREFYANAEEGTVVKPREETVEPEKVEAVMTPVESSAKKERSRVDYQSMYVKSPDIEKSEVIEPTPEPEPEKIEEDAEEQTPPKKFLVPDDELEVMSDADYLINESRYRQVPLNYYHGDDILCDQNDKIIRGEERASVVGEKIEKLLRSSSGPNNKDVLYFRNDKVENEFEVFWNQENYSDEVGPIDPE